MGLREQIDRLFGRRSAPNATLAADRERQQQMHGQETGQTDEEQAAMRRRMETDMDDQRAQREPRRDPTEG